LLASLALLSIFIKEKDMRTFEEDLAAVKALQHGEHTFVNSFQDGGGKIYRVRDALLLFSVPLYGGKPKFCAGYHYLDAKKAVTEAHSWT
jgi:hypothetical protein